MRTRRWWSWLPSSTASTPPHVPGGSTLGSRGGVAEFHDIFGSADGLVLVNSKRPARSQMIVNRLQDWYLEGYRRHALRSCARPDPKLTNRTPALTRNDDTQRICSARSGAAALLVVLALLGVPVPGAKTARLDSAGGELGFSTLWRRWDTSRQRHARVGYVLPQQVLRVSRAPRMQGAAKALARRSRRAETGGRVLVEQAEPVRSR